MRTESLKLNNSTINKYQSFCHPLGSTINVMIIDGHHYYENFEIVSAHTITKYMQWQLPNYELFVEGRCTEIAILQSWGGRDFHGVKNWEMFVAGLSAFVCLNSSGSCQNMKSPPLPKHGGNEWARPHIPRSTVLLLKYLI